MPTSGGGRGLAVCGYGVCPVTPGVRRRSWPVDDPIRLPIEEVRPIRDEIERHVEQLVHEL